MKKLALTINGITIEAKEGMTVMEAARSANIRIPSLCFMKEIHQIGACRICLVEIQGLRGLQPSCTYPVEEGMVVETNSRKVRTVRKNVLELILSQHPQDCLHCLRNLDCELQALSAELGVDRISFPGVPEEKEDKGTWLPETWAIERNPDKCILCRRCISVCTKIQEMGIFSAMDRGYYTRVSTAFDQPLEEIQCTLCGQCITVCPVNALVEKDATQAVWEALENPELHVVVQTAPSVRATLGEEFGLPIGTPVQGKMIKALRLLGFDKVFDTDFTADLTIMEEGAEFLERLENQGVLPLITSCSPGWVKYCEHHYPDLLPHMSSCKSPQQMFGALSKTYYPEVSGMDSKKIFSVSVMPCTAKKYEAARPEINASEGRDVDAVLTIRELGRMIRSAGIDFLSLPEDEFDSPMGESTGAGVIFGTTGGVMEAALRTVAEILTGKTLETLEFRQVRGLKEGLKEAELEIGGRTIRVAVAHGLGNAKLLMEKVKAGQSYHFIEVMACPGGCIGGGGTPLVSAQTRAALREDYRLLRARAIYDADCRNQVRQSHKNPSLLRLYREYLGKPNGEKSHRLLHTHYVKRTPYPEDVTDL